MMYDKKKKKKTFILFSCTLTLDSHSHNSQQQQRKISTLYDSKPIVSQIPFTCACPDPLNFESHTADIIVIPVPSTPNVMPNAINAIPFFRMPNVISMHAGKMNWMVVPAVEPIREITNPMSSPIHRNPKARASVNIWITTVVTT